MAFVTVACPSCRVSSRFATATRGKVTCSQCGHGFTIPQHGPAQSPSKKQIAVAQPFRSSPNTQNGMRRKSIPATAVGLVLAAVAVLVLVPVGIAVFVVLGSQNAPSAAVAEIDETSDFGIDVKPDSPRPNTDPPNKQRQSNYSGAEDEPPTKPNENGDPPPDKSPPADTSGQSSSNEPPEPDKGSPNKTEVSPDKKQKDPANTGRRLGLVFGGLSPLKRSEELQQPGLIVWTKSKLNYHIDPIKVAGKKRLRLAVVPGRYDNIGSLLNKLGDGYQYDILTNNHFYQIQNLLPFDAIFLNCGGTINLDSRIIYNIRHYIHQGGTLYASDLQYSTLAGVFPKNIIRTTGMRTLRGNITASVVDPGLRSVLGEKVDLHFDLTHKPAAFNSKFTRFYLAAPPGQTRFRKYGWTPLLAKFPFGKGHVIFTSYHNSKNINPTTLKLLLYIVFSAVNSEVETQVYAAMVRDGFTPLEAKTLNIAQGFTLPKRPIQHSKDGTLRFALGIRDQGAKMRLRVFTPAGKIIEHTDQNGFRMQINNAPAGLWHYSVTALETPFDNYPYSIMVTEAKTAAKQPMTEPAKPNTPPKAPPPTGNGKIKLPG